jgi:hypothetical protein
VPAVLPPVLAERAIADATGDTIDAVAAAVQAAWALARADDGYGAPLDADPLEGWVVAA